MFSRMISIAASMLGAIAVLLIIGVANAEELPEGIKVKLIAEYASRVPTLEKVRLVKVVMQPDAAFDNIVIKNEEYCQLLQGQLTRTNHTLGVTNVLSVGAFWAPPKGDRHTVTNTGEDVAIMWVYQLVEKDAGEGDKM